jgi:hypothetical protein
MPRSSAELECDLEAIDKMAEELDQAEKEVAQATVPPPPKPVAEKPPEAAPLPASPEPVAEGEDNPRPNIPILPATGRILENLSGAMGLLIEGAQASIVGAGLHENAEQLGPLSLVLSDLKRAKNQADQLLGKKNE